MIVRDVLKEGSSVRENIEREISGVVYDSRNIRGGELFVAIRGENFDGHDFIGDAIKRGAAAIVYEDRRQKTPTVGAQAENKRQSPEDRKLNKDLECLMGEHPEMVWIGVDDSRDALAAISDIFYKRPSEGLAVIGLTGTNGKTTTSYLIRSILKSWSKKTGLIGTINYMINDTTYEAPHTTPEAPDFQALLREMAEKGCSHVIAEVSSHALAQKRVAYTKFRAAVFTNLTRDHLDFHHTMENYFRAKEKLFTELLSDSGVAVVNIDDRYGERLVDVLKSRQAGGSEIRIVTYSIEKPGADFTVSDIRATFKGTTFKLKMQNAGRKNEAKEYELFTPLAGAMNVYNVLAAAAVSLSLNIPIEIIKEGIEMTLTVKGRFEKVELGQDFLAVVDYAHTEDALERLLLTARQLLEAYHFAAKTEIMMKAKRRQFSLPEKTEKGKIITVFGCGGNRDKGKRVKMGEIAAKLSDFVIITSDNPRNEDPKRIIRDIEKGIDNDNYIVIPDRNVAISMAVELASPGDIVLVAGKGHEGYQEIQGARHDFSDKVALEKAIRRAISRPAFGGGTTYKGAETVRC